MQYDPYIVSENSEEKKGWQPSPILGVFVALLFIIGSGVIMMYRPVPITEIPVTSSIQAQVSEQQEVSVEPLETAIAISAHHLPVPEHVRAIYISSWTAGSTKGMSRIYELLSGGVVNAVVLDIKDDTGMLSYKPLDQTLISAGTNRIPDMRALTAELHRRNIYIIGRISVFQDPFFAAIAPEYALLDTVTGLQWKDHKGLLYLRPFDKNVWDRTVAIARDAYLHGIDEINLDYVRFPSDGVLATIDTREMNGTKADTIAAFFEYMDLEIRKESNIPLSADVFGLVTSSRGDVGIGQVLERIAPHVDYLAPMVYPSHYAAGSFGIPNPAQEPYEIVRRALADGAARLTAIDISPSILRPWLQDFDLGAVYDKDMVLAQIEAGRSLGINSWMMWDPANKYTPEVYLQIQGE